MDHDSHTDDEIRKIYTLKNIAVVGMSKDPNKAAHYVPKYLHERGYNIIPVNPTTDEILGKKCYSNLLDVIEEIDVVDVFRPSDQILPIVDSCIQVMPKVLWLQEGIHNPNAEANALRSGIQVIYNRCMLAEHQRLF
jgi:uncharacterized protein